jgi:hypothetical protein
MFISTIITTPPMTHPSLIILLSWLYFLIYHRRVWNCLRLFSPFIRTWKDWCGIWSGIQRDSFQYYSFSSTSSQANWSVATRNRVIVFYVRAMPDLYTVCSLTHLTVCERWGLLSVRFVLRFSLSFSRLIFLMLDLSVVLVVGASRLFSSLKALIVSVVTERQLEFRLIIFLIWKIHSSLHKPLENQFGLQVPWTAV